MKLRFSKIEKYIITVSVLLILLFIVYIHFYQLVPLQSELTSRKAELQSEQKLVDIMTQKSTGNGEPTIENTRELQQKVPVKPLQEQLILDIEKAETLSNSEIQSMSFSADGEVNMKSAETNKKNSADAPQAEDPSDRKQQNAIATPTSLRKLSVKLTVESPSYEKFETFVETLESLKRIVVVESINYSGGEEITRLDQEKQQLDYTLTISAYYMPDLADLQAQLPKIDAPAPAGKDNPLNQFSDLNSTN